MFILFVLRFGVFLALILLKDLLSVILRVSYRTLVHINEKLRKKTHNNNIFYFKLLPEVEEYTFKKENCTCLRDKPDTFNIQILMFSQGDIRLRQGSTCPVGVFLATTISLLTKKISSSKHLSWGNTFWEIFLFSSHIRILSCIYILLKYFVNWNRSCSTNQVDIKDREQLWLGL